MLEFRNKLQPKLQLTYLGDLQSYWSCRIPEHIGKLYAPFSLKKKKSRLYKKKETNSSNRDHFMKKFFWKIYSRTNIRDSTNRSVLHSRCEKVTYWYDSVTLYFTDIIYLYIPVC